MASNDGQRLLVLGLSFRQHHTLHMQQVLRAYDRLPENPMDRASLYTSLFQLAKDLDEDEARNIEHWLINGGEFPAPAPRAPTTPAGPINEGADDVDDEEESWEDYRPEGFEDGVVPGRDEDAVMTEDSEDEENSVGREEEGDDRTTVSSSEPDDGGDDEQELDAEERVSQVLRRHGQTESEDESDAEEVRAYLRRHGRIPPNEDSDSEDEVERAHFRRRRGRVANNSSTGKSKSTEELLECHICADEYTPSDFPAPITSTCDHKYNERVCIYCLQQTIGSEVAEGQLNIGCPFCPEKLSRDEVRKYATQEVFARYEYLSMRANPDLILCLGPDCGAGQVHTDEKNPMMICEVCSFKTCAVHKLPWHEGKSCEEFDCDDSQIERLEQAEATAKLLAKEHAQVCPNCHQGVSRSEGCDHMTCRCGMEWCYLCGTSYENIKRLGDNAHAPTCIYHPRRVQMRKDQEQAHQGQLTELLHGGAVSETLERARGARNARVRAELRPKAAEAAERRMREMDQQKKEDGVVEKKRRLNLHPAWEER